MLENPEKLREMIHKTGAKSSDLESPESVDHLCAKCDQYALNWAPKLRNSGRKIRAAETLRAVSRSKISVRLTESGKRQESSGDGIQKMSTALCRAEAITM